MPMNENTVETSENTDVWPPVPTSQAPTPRKKLGLFHPMADTPAWVLPLVFFGDILVFTGGYFLRHYLSHRPIVWLDAFILGPVLGLMPFGLTLHFWLSARRKRRNNPAD